VKGDFLNFIVTPTRSSLSIKTITPLLFIKIVGPLITHIDPTKRAIVASSRTPFSSGYEKQGAEENRRNISRVEQNLDYILKSKCGSILFLSLM
jgi:hypothetical protein